MGKRASLKEYRKKRDFQRTREPKGGGRSAKKDPIFVIQKHDASRLHYDFRLEVDGALKSWAVPKGPSTDPGVKRLAVQVEDHPMDYASFEGTIPEGEYGGGTVMVWDAGFYRNIRDEKDKKVSMRESLEQGQVEVRLNGMKLKGAYALVRTGLGKDSKKSDKPQWLLIKMKDDEADARRNPVNTETKSVLTGRTLKQIAQEAAKAKG